MRITLFPQLCSQSSSECNTEIQIRCTTELSNKTMRIIILLCIFIVATNAICESDENAEPHVELDKLGGIRGSKLTSRLGRTIYSFRGIRFAEPPIGNLRFCAPVDVSPWNETFDASEEGPMCPQPRNPAWKDPMSEDCLRLNIYTTQLPSETCRAVRPVVVFFHPGAFYFFTAQSSMFGPQYLMDQDVVLVTVNYRLAPLGFLSTGDEHAPGNFGLKDQVTALRFVRDHIHHFGGNPDDVTIAGYSAGSISVSLHLVSPMSQGLFHRAIAMSGAATNQNLLPPHQKDLAKKIAGRVDCDKDSSEDLINCLREKPVDDLVKAMSAISDNWMAVVVEPEIPGVERFLHAQPVDLIRQGQFAKVPVISGVTRDDFAGLVIGPVEAARAGNTSALDDYNENWTKIAPIRFHYERGTQRSLEISEEFRQFYLKGQPISLDNTEGLSQLFADGLIVFGQHRLTNLLGQYSDQPVYYFKFTYQGRYSFYTWSDKTPFGVCHHDDLIYIFFIKTMFPYFESDAPEIPMVETMTSIWGNFIRTGNPIPQDQGGYDGVTWTPFTPENQAYLDINTDLVMKSRMNIERMNEWERLFPLRPLQESSTY